MVSISTRKAVRAILFDEKKRVALMSVSKHNYHKLPGGGIEEGENTEEALRREIKEETGGEIEITGEVGKIIEEKSHYSKIQESYCFIAKLRKLGKPEFTEHEIEGGFSLIWVPLDEAISIMEKDTLEDYTGKFIRLRDLSFLRA